MQAEPAWSAAPPDPARSLMPLHPDPASGLVEAGWTLGGEGIRVRYGEGATFWIDAGFGNVWMRWQAPLVAADAAYFLADPVMAFVLRKKGVLTLHASAVAFGATAVLFAGAAGAGKSLVAAACVAAGGNLITDDVAAIRRADGAMHVAVGPAAIRAWDDGTAALLGDASRAPIFSPTWSKRVIAPDLLGGSAATASTRLGMICALGARSEGGTEVRIEALNGREALETILPVTAANHIHDPETRAEELGQIAELLEAVPAARLTVSDDPVALRGVSQAVRRALSG